MTRAIIDTHTFLWLVADDPRLSRPAREFVEDVSNDLLLSVASAWEIAIKVGKGRLTLAVPLPDLLTTVLTQFSIDLLPIKPDHLVAVASLPTHHGDPFDRLLVAQCVTEGLPIVSTDAAFDLYGVHRIW